MRTSLNIDDETATLIAETADAQNRTVAGQLRHLLKTHPEIVGWKAFKSNPSYQAMANAAPVRLGK